MQSLRFFLLPLFFCALVSLRAQDAPTVNADSILHDLDALEQQQRVTIQNARQNVFNLLKSSSFNGQSAVNLYIDAMEAVEFEGKPNKGATFSDWKTSNGDLFRSNEMQELLLLHLKYVVLSLERAASDNPNLFVTPALTYATELVAYQDKFPPSSLPGRGDRGSDKDRASGKLYAELRKSLLDSSMGDTVFAKWLHFGQWLPKDGWETSPGNLSGILEKDIRNPLRKQKSAQLAQTWDFEMQVLANRATAGRLDYLAADFNTAIRPQKIYERANDYIILGQKNRGISDIYMLVKTYPQHPDFGKWVSRLRELIAKMQATPTPAPADSTAAPAPGTAPQ